MMRKIIEGVIRILLNISMRLLRHYPNAVKLFSDLGDNSVSEDFKRRMNEMLAKRYIYSPQEFYEEMLFYTHSFDELLAGIFNLGSYNGIDQMLNSIISSFLLSLWKTYKEGNFSWDVFLKLLEEKNTEKIIRFLPPVFAGVFITIVDIGGEAGWNLLYYRTKKFMKEIKESPQREYSNFVLLKTPLSTVILDPEDLDKIDLATLSVFGGSKNGNDG